MLGWNGITSYGYLATDFAAEIAYVRTFLNKLHTDFPSAVVRILGLQVPDPLGGLGTNYGASSVCANHFKLLKYSNGLNMAYKAVCAEAAYSAWTRFIAIAPQFDSENNMRQTTKAVNARNATTEVFGVNGVHPDTEGYLQIADAAYRDFIRTYCSS
jgi:lysophospholipase L1-like esterase